MKYIFKNIYIIKDFGNSVEGTAGYIEVLHFRNIKYVDLNENCFIGHLVVYKCSTVE